MKHFCPMCGEQWNDDECRGCGWLEAPEVILEEDGDIGFDWHMGTACISAHVSANGRGGFAALVGDYRSTGTFQLPEWPDDLTHALKLLMARPASSPAWEPKLRTLIAKWRAEAMQDAHYAHVPEALRWCANALEALLPPPPKAHP